MEDRGPDLVQRRADTHNRLEVVAAMVAAVDRRREVLDVVADAATVEEAVPRLVELLGCAEIGALAVLDCQVRRFAAGERSRLRDMRDDLVAELESLGDPDDKPLVVGRGLLWVDLFCEATGLTRADVEPLLEDGRVEGVHLEDGTWHGLFDDVLPTREDLLGWGLSVDPAYDPELLRSHDGPADDEEEEEEFDEDDDSDGTWTMSWPSEPPTT